MDRVKSNRRTTRFHGMKSPIVTATLLPAIYITMVAVLSLNIDTRASAPIRIGVLAHKGTDICRKMWQPTMDYLNKELSGRKLDLVPLRFEEIEPAVLNKSFDFLICNPAIYVDLEVRYGVTRTLTLRNWVGTELVSEFGGVIFCRADRTDTIERMVADGEIRLDAIRIIPADTMPGSLSTFPYLHSTRLYPEWPFAKLSDTSEDLSREVIVALLSMPADSPAAIAAQSGGWGVCLDYTSVHNCLREVAFEMEKASRAGDLNAAGRHMPELEAQCNWSKQALTKELSTDSKGGLHEDTGC